MTSAQDTFQRLADDMKGLLQGGEVYICNFASEDSDFIRFNQAKVRQAGHVAQQSVQVDLIEGKRLSENITDNEAWRAERPAQFSVREDDLVDAVRKLLAQQASEG